MLRSNFYLKELKISIRVARIMELKRIYKKYYEYVLFNKNLLISGIFAFFGGALFTQIYSKYDSNNFVNSIMTLSVEYGIYIPIFTLFFYLDNKNKYIDRSTGKKDYRKIKSDLKKLLAAFSASEATYSFAKISIHYELLQTHLTAAYEASMIASLIAWIIFLISINLTLKVVKLFKSE